jgi:hypothetical protein
VTALQNPQNNRRFLLGFGGVVVKKLARPNAKKQPTMVFIPSARRSVHPFASAVEACLPVISPSCSVICGVKSSFKIQIDLPNFDDVADGITKPFVQKESEVQIR